MPQAGGDPGLAVVPGGPHTAGNNPGSMQTSGQAQLLAEDLSAFDDMFSGSGVATPNGGVMEEFYNTYRGTLPSSSFEAMLEKVQEDAASLGRQVLQARGEGNSELAFTLLERKHNTLAALGQWQAAIDLGIPHRKLVALYKESARQQALQPGINMFEFTMKAASSKTWVSAFTSLFGGAAPSAQVAGGARVNKRPSLEGPVCHRCGQRGHMVKDRHGVVVCPQALEDMEARKKARTS